MKLLAATESYEDVVARHRLAFVYFTAQWCGPCKRVSPVFESLSTGAPDGTVFLKVDVDDHDAACTRLKIESVPTLLVFVDGKCVERLGVAVDTLTNTVRHYMATSK